MQFCKNCGKELDADDKFCPHCGTPNPLHNNDNRTYNKKSEKAKGSNKTVKRENRIYGKINLKDLPKDYIIDNRYKVLEKIGSGGFGTVYKVFDKDMSKVKAIKVIFSEFYDDKEVILDLKSESSKMDEIFSEHIVKFYDIHLSGNLKFIDMEYVGGGDLVDLKIKYSDKKVPENRVLDIATQIAEGMKKVHDGNIIHKDIKPKNILLTKGGLVKIMDFGIAESFRSSRSRIKETSRSGTPAYMSPEQIIGEDVGKESDIWSFGVMLYELLSGKQLYRGQTTNEVLLQIERKKFKPIKGISDKTNKLLQRCLQYNYQDRFRNFGEVGKYLNEKKEKKIIITSKNFKMENDEIIPENMILVEGGTFQMGSDDGAKDKRPIHKVKLNSFYIGKYPVTQKEWKRVMGNSPSHFVMKSGFLGLGEKHDLGMNPVESVSWYDAVEFCNKKSEMEGLENCYSGKRKNIKCDFSKNGYRLPTEAEWEYAARGGNKSNNYKYSGSNNKNRVAWYGGNSHKRTHPVGQKQSNELGIYDLSGNVWEWCWDWFDIDYSTNPKNNTTASNTTSYRVLRGGSWHSLHFFYKSCFKCLVSYRNHHSPEVSENFIGLRLVKSVGLCK